MCDVSGAWGHVDEARDVWAAVGGHGVLPAWGTSAACAGDVSGAWEHGDEARDAATIYASVLDYIHLRARASAANGERSEGGGRRYKSMSGKNGEVGKSRVRVKVVSIIGWGDTLASKVVHTDFLPSARFWGHNNTLHVPLSATNCRSESRSQHGSDK